MPTIPYIRRVSAAALGSIDSVLSHWLPGGKREGSEYLTLNPKRADSAPGSFSINLKTGKWSDFATGDKGLDLVALVAYLENETQGKAARRLAAFLGIEPEENSPPKRTGSDSRKPGNGKPSTSNKEANAATVPPGGGSDGDGWQCAMPVPDDAPPPPAAHSKHGKPSRRYPYLAQDGRVNFYHDRYDKPKGEKKQFSPLTLWRKADKYEWRFKVSRACARCTACRDCCNSLMLCAGLSKVRRQPKPCKCCCLIILSCAGKAEAKPWRKAIMPRWPGVIA